jgi:membrane-associated phospholipid phosphatase
MSKSLIALLLLSSLSIQAQDGNAASRFMRDFASGQKRIWTSPLHMNKRQFWTLAVPLVGGTVGLKSLDRRIIDGLPNTPDQIDWSKRVSLIGGAYTLGAGAGLTTAAGHYYRKPAALETGRNAGLALASSMTVTYALKLAFMRERPDTPGSRGSFWSGGDSFPSGHAMTSFAVAAAVASHPRCPEWLSITLYASATAISLSRISSNRHWPADVYFGAFTGVLIGRSVTRASLRR